jgi:hypothetical protein
MWQTCHNLLILIKFRRECHSMAKLKGRTVAGPVVVHTFNGCMLKDQRTGA